MDATRPAARRRAFARALSRVANASICEVLGLDFSAEHSSWRIGVTGPPGAGKSSLISRLARARLDQWPAAEANGSAAERLAVLAIDPSSPGGGGALLGDRVRMDALAADPRVFIRSLASRGGPDGLAHNVVDLLALADAYGFEEVILETVGVGQSDFAARILVDSLILVLHPEAGDSIQAMKSGLMELADIYVVNKADLPGAARTAAELNAVLKIARPQASGWKPPVVQVGLGREDGIAALFEALTAHRKHAERTADPVRIFEERQRYHLRSLLVRKVEEVLAADRSQHARENLASRYERAIKSFPMS